MRSLVAGQACAAAINANTLVALQLASKLVFTSSAVESRITEATTEVANTMIRAVLGAAERHSCLARLASETRIAQAFAPEATSSAVAVGWAATVVSSGLDHGAVRASVRMHAGTGAVAANTALIASVGASIGSQIGDSRREGSSLDLLRKESVAGGLVAISTTPAGSAHALAIRAHAIDGALGRALLLSVTSKARPSRLAEALSELADTPAIAVVVASEVGGDGAVTSSVAVDAEALASNAGTIVRALLGALFSAESQLLTAFAGVSRLASAGAGHANTATRAGKAVLAGASLRNCAIVSLPAGEAVALAENADSLFLRAAMLAYALLAVFAL